MRKTEKERPQTWSEKAKPARYIRRHSTGCDEQVTMTSNGAACRH